MKKDTVRAAAVAVIAFIIYNSIVFVIPFAHTAAFWISYGFGLAAFAVVAASVYIAFIKQPDVKSRFYGFPVARIGVIYGSSQLAASVLVMALALWMPWWIPVVVFSVGLGAAVIGLIGAETVVEEIHAQDEKLKKNTARMKEMQSKINQMAAQFGSASLKTLAEEFRYSDPVSSDAIAEAEADLAASVDELQSAVVEDDAASAEQLCRRVTVLLAERNRLCKLNKN